MKGLHRRRRGVAVVIALALAMVVGTGPALAETTPEEPTASQEATLKTAVEEDEDVIQLTSDEQEDPGEKTIELGAPDDEETRLSAQLTSHSRSEALANRGEKDSGVTLESQAQANPYGRGWCTWYAWQRAADCAAGVGGWMPTIWGNAGDWYANAPSAGLSVGATPKANSIVVFGGGQYGHVGWVEGVHDGQIDIADMNGSAGFGNVSWHTISSALGPSLYGYRLLGYIYVPGTIEPGNPIPGPILGKPYVDYAPGDFVIRSAIGNKVLTIGGGSHGENGANAQLWTGDAFDNSVFRIEWNGNAGGYRIWLKSSGKNLDASGGLTATITNVVQWDNYDSPHQHWVFQDAGDGWIYIRNLNGYYLDVVNGWDSNYDGGNVQTYTANESVAQKWKLERQVPGDILPNSYVDYAPGDFVVRSAIGGKVLTIGGGDQGENGANAQLWTGDAFGNSVFHVAWNDKAGGYRISLKASDKNLDASGGKTATITNVVQWENYDSPHQHWLFQDAGDGWVYIRNLNGFYLDVEGGWDSNRDGGNVQTWVANCADAQKWKLERIKQRQTIKASNLSVAIGKTAMLGATASGGGRISYRTGNANIAKVSANGKVTPVSVGSTTITISAAGNDVWESVSNKVTVTIVMGTNPLTVKATSKSASLKTLKKKAVVVAPLTVTKAKGKVTYKKASGAACLTVNKSTGKVTVKKGTKKGTYTAKVKITAAGNTNYKARSKTVTCKVIVK